MEHYMHDVIIDAFITRLGMLGNIYLIEQFDI